MTAESNGQSSLSSAILADRAHAIGLPFGFKSAPKICTIKNFRPCKVSFLTVETTLPMTRAICITYPFAFFPVRKSNYQKYND